MLGPAGSAPAPAAAEPPAALAAPGDGARRLCRISDPRVPESSGLAATGELIYTVNDGGDRVAVVVLDRSCRVRRTITGTVDPYDVEDLARSPDGAFWLADIGDNDQARDTVALELLDEDGRTTLFRFRYPDGPHDAEALLVDTRGRPFLVTKEPFGGRVYTPAGTPSTRRPTDLRRVASLSFGLTGTAGGPVGAASQVLVTGGAVAPDGRRLVLRTYTDAYLWDVPGGDVADALANGRPTRVPLPATAQGEAVTFAPDGRTLLTSTEGLPAPVHVVPLPAGPAGRATPGAAAEGGAGRPGADEPAADEPGVSRGSSAIIAALAAAAVVWAGSKVRRSSRSSAE